MYSTDRSYMYYIMSLRCLYEVKSQHQNSIIISTLLPFSPLLYQLALTTWQPSINVVISTFYSLFILFPLQLESSNNCFHFFPEYLLDTCWYNSTSRYPYIYVDSFLEFPCLPGLVIAPPWVLSIPIFNLSPYKFMIINVELSYSRTYKSSCL